MLENINMIQWFIALIPVISILFLMMFLDWSGGKAGSFSWILAAILSFTVFGGNFKLISIASLKGLWTTVFILYIIWGAMALFNIVDRVNGFEVIADKFTSLTGGDKLLQLLVVGWALTTFVQGVTGFGTPIAVSALLLVGLGFNPVMATASSLMGHAWAVGFGSLGSSYGVLVNLSGLDPSGLAFWSSLFLGSICLMTGFAISYLYNGWKGVKHGFMAVIVMGITMGGTLILVANFVLPYIASLVAGTVGLFFGAVVLPRFKWYQKGKSELLEKKSKEHKIDFHTAFAPYYFLLTSVFVIYLTPLNNILSKYKIGFSFPRTSTSLGFINKAVESYSPISILTTPGTLILLSAICSILFYKYKGLWKKEYSKKILTSISGQALPSTITVMSMSMMSVVMMDSGIIKLLAEGTAMMTESIYPVFSPIIGILGTFMTGSTTSSNILFSAFQKDVAEIIGINSLAITSLQTAGGSLGKMMTPTTIALGTGVTNIVGREGEVMKKTMGYAIIMALIIGAASYIIL